MRSDPVTGYAHPDYARSLAVFGEPIALPRSGGWLLRRQIGDAGAQDAMGCYPLFTCLDWSQLEADLDELSRALVTVVLVTDPFGNYRPSQLEGYFDVVRPFKQHFVVDCASSPGKIGSAHHLYYARRGLKRLHVEQCDEPLGFLDEWCELYGNLVGRHQIAGIRAFSRAAFACQLGVPGTMLFRAVCEGKTVAAHWYYVQGDVAYSHLAAQNQRGYELSAAYALHWYGIQSLRAHVKWLDLGAGAGAEARATDGLATFKRGWSTSTRTAYLCGKILNPALYDRIMKTKPEAGANYFPPYRHGEFV